jgi:hypothetical protein
MNVLRRESTHISSSQNFLYIALEGGVHILLPNAY